MTWDMTSTSYQASDVAVDVSIGDIWTGASVTFKRAIHYLNPASGRMELPTQIAAIRADPVGGGGTVAGVVLLPVIGAICPLGATWETVALLRTIDCSSQSPGILASLRYSTRYFYGVPKGIAIGADFDLSDAADLPEGNYLPAQAVPILANRATKFYRDDPGMTSPSSSLDKSAADIAGISKIRDVDVTQIGIRVRLIYDAEDADTVGVIGTMRAAMGTRNLYSFLGFDAGTLLCRGGSVAHIEHEFWEVVFDFIFDEYFGHAQEPQLAVDGRPLGGATYTDVRWVREARSTADFNDLFSATDIGKCYKFQCFKGYWR